jgi:hypothetical protein
MSLEHMQLLAFAAGFGAVFEDELDIQRDVPPDDTVAEARTGRHFVPGWHMPDAPAPRTALLSHDRSRALAVVEPLWRAQSPATQPVARWAQHVVAVARGMTALIPGRSIPA